MELVVAVDVGLNDGHAGRALVGLLPAQPDAEREKHGQKQHARGCHPAPYAAPRLPSLEKENVAEQHPQRTAEDTRIFVPLHGPHVVRETVAEDEPRPREFAHGVPVFGGEPCGDQHRVGQRLGTFFGDAVVEHESHEVQRRGRERGCNGPHGRGVPYPPDGGDVPQRESERRPPQHAPPRAARCVVSRTYPQQRHERHRQREPRKRKPASREQEDRTDCRRDFTRHVGVILCVQK